MRACAPASFSRQGAGSREGRGPSTHTALASTMSPRQILGLQSDAALAAIAMLALDCRPCMCCFLARRPLQRHARPRGARAGHSLRTPVPPAYCVRPRTVCCARAHAAPCAFKRAGAQAKAAHLRCGVGFAELVDQAHLGRRCHGVRVKSGLVVRVLASFASPASLASPALCSRRPRSALSRRSPRPRSARVCRALARSLLVCSRRSPRPLLPRWGLMTPPPHQINALFRPYF